MVMNPITLSTYLQSNSTVIYPKMKKEFLVVTNNANFRIQ